MVGKDPRRGDETAKRNAERVEASRAGPTASQKKARGVALGCVGISGLLVAVAVIGSQIETDRAEISRAEREASLAGTKAQVEADAAARKATAKVEN